MATLWVILCIIASSLIILLFVRTSPRKLRAVERARISEIGISHYTTAESAPQILETLCVKGRSKKKPNKKSDSYFLMNEQIPTNILSNNHLLDKPCKVVIKNLSEKQMKMLKIRKEDFALRCKGDFLLLEDANEVYFEPVDHESNTLFSCSCRSYRKLTSLNLIALMVAFVAMGIVSALAP
jgi:hypothetical protein